jgi:hypothetical protein
MSADLCPTTGEMHRADWSECEHCGYPTPEDRIAVLEGEVDSLIAERDVYRERSAAWKGLAQLRGMALLAYRHGGEPTEATCRAIQQAQFDLAVIDPPAVDDLTELQLRIDQLQDGAS